MIRLSKSVLSDQEIDAVVGVLKEGFLGMGKEVQAFEKELEVFIGNNVVVTCVSTGTSALHLACQAIGLRPGDEILIPSLTYVASHQAASATGATPISVDICPETGLMDLNEVEQKISKDTKAIMYVHYASQLGNLDELYAIAKKHDLRVIEDAAHSFGCEYHGRKVGSFGDITCFSFDGIKNITSGEGGAIVSKDAMVNEHCKDARLLGVQKDTENRFERKRSWNFDVEIQGWRYHMSEIMASIGRVQLKRFPSFAQCRIEHAHLYRKKLNCVEGIDLFEKVEGDFYIVPHIFPIKIKNGKRDELGEFLKENGVQFGVHYFPNHLLTKYKHEKNSSCLNTEEVYRQLITLPLHPDLSVEDVNKVCELVKTFFIK